jgi:hypothetical protein
MRERTEILNSNGCFTRARDNEVSVRQKAERLDRADVATDRTSNERTSACVPYSNNKIVRTRSDVHVVRGESDRIDLAGVAQKWISYELSRIYILDSDSLVTRAEDDELTIR